MILAVVEPLWYQGRQQHKISGTAHYRSALRKAVPRGTLHVGRGVKADLSAQSVEKIFRMYF